MTWSAPTIGTAADAPARHRSFRSPVNNWTALAVPHVDDPRSAADWRRHRELAKKVHRWCRASEAEFLVIHAGHAPTAELIDIAISALHNPIDRGAAARELGVPEVADICIADDGSEPLLSLTWQMLSRRGLNTVTIRHHRDPLDRRAPASRPDEPPIPEHPMVVVRRSSIVERAPEQERTAWQRPSWWAATLAVCMFTIWNLIQIGRQTIETTAVELLWLDAAERGTVNGSIGAMSGTGVWPALMEPVIGTLGFTAVRVVSVFFAVGAVACLANASSRVFGRWAARTTAVAMTIALAVTGVATDATPIPLAILALAIGVHGIALAVTTDRPSWLVLSAAATSLAIAVQFQTFAVAIALPIVIAFFGGHRRRVNVQLYTLTSLACTAWWLIPLDLPISIYIVTIRDSLPPLALGENVVKFGVVAAVVAATYIVLRVAIASQLVRRRLLVLGFAAAILPTFRLLVGATMEMSDIAIAASLFAPVLGGLVAHFAAAISAGEQVEPARRTSPDLLKIDPSTGMPRGNHIHFTNRQMYLAGVLLAVNSLWFFPWAIPHMAWGTWWLAIPFLVCNASVASTAGLLMFNNARQSIPLHIDVAVGHEPLVGVIVPMVDEPIEMVNATVMSVIEQDWPIDRLRIVVSDDGYSDEVQQHFMALAATLPDNVLTYFRPPKRGSIGRTGESKAGNLNAAILPLSDAHCEYIETRDADDLVGCSNFLRATVGHMMTDQRIAYVQTIKESHTSDGDPFNNNEVLFYRGMTLARNVHHAALPCGSGLVWRRAALRDIGHFPVWNLVEDIHSGVLALRAGWRGLFVPIVGSFAQHAPEDIANYFKQRGTWALDSIRLVIFDRFRGIPWRARLQLFEQTAFYLLSIPVMGLLVLPIFGLVLGRYPIEADGMDYALHFTGFAVSLELCMFAFASGQPISAYIRTRLFIVGMAPLYAASVVRAIWYGANRKPIYVVTRKADRHQVYFRMLKVHWLLIGLIVSALLLAVLRRDESSTFDPGIVYWAFAGIAGLGSFLRLSWFGVDLRQLFKRQPAPDEHAVELPG